MGDVAVFVGADGELTEANFEVGERGRGQGNGGRGACSFGVDGCGRHDWISRVVDSAVAGVGWTKKGGEEGVGSGRMAAESERFQVKQCGCFHF